RARLVYHRKGDSIEAHLSFVFAAFAITRLIEARTGWSVKKFVRTTRRYRTINIRAGAHVLVAEDPLPNDLRDALAVIT
ncbi:MAG: IS1634 family transposase, partial [Streptosporangiaceae bacterium]